MKLASHACAVALLLTVLVAPSSAKDDANKPAPQPSAVDFSELDKLVPAELQEKNTPGAVITVISGDQVVYQKAFGLTNVETNAAMQPEMLFRLGSTTKMFTAAALLALAEKGRINLNEPIGNRVKGLSAKIAKTTPHHLLSNSAGVRDFAAPVISNDDASLGNMVRAWNDDVFFAEQSEIYSYSSPGFWLSGFVVEELQGKPYADSMTELVFKPYSHAPTIWKVSVKDSKLYVKFDGNEYALTKSGNRKFTFGAQNENELVFVPGQNGKIGFLFTGLYGAKKI